MYADTLYKVTDVTSAKKAIKMIVQQGEGASPQDPTYLKSNELAHFYRFGELACMHHMISEREHEYGYQGRPIQFIPEGVWPMRDPYQQISLQTLNCTIKPRNFTTLIVHY